MEHNASIDAVYDVVERIEQQKKRLTRSLVALSISALLGLVVKYVCLYDIFAPKRSIE